MKTKTVNLTIILLLVFTSVALGQFKIQGLVTDNSQTPLVGVIVENETGTNGTRTDFSGHFELRLDSLSGNLVFSFPGLETQTIAIHNKTFLQVMLEPEIVQEQELSEMVTVSARQMSGVVAQKSIRIGMATAIHPAAPSFDLHTEDYSTIQESGYKNVLNDPLSTFAIDVDRASYSNIRRFLNMGQLPPKDAVRVEEMINYFNYNYREPAKDEPFTMIRELSTCLWNSAHQLVLVGLQTRKIETKDLPPSNLVFLIDVSGSMQAANKLPLVQSSLKMLTNNLRPQDKVAIVVYAGAAGLVLESTPGSNKQKITEAIEKLKAGGSTAGGAGLKLAYKVAAENFIKEGNNRIIIATDGDFNVGQSSDAEMERLVEQQRDYNIFLSVLGFGMGNLKDNKLEILADKGNGNYAYIDNSQEARKVLVEEFGGTLFTVAKDVKIQIEFNPSLVKAYRLIGYENRMLADEDFNNDKKDAGELGAGHQVTALYEIIPASSDEAIPATDALKYQSPSRKTKGSNSNEILTLKMRYKSPESSTSKLMVNTLVNHCTSFEESSDNMKLASAVAEFGMLLRNSEYKGSASANAIVTITGSIESEDTEGYISEFKRLVKLAESLGLSNHASL